MCRYKADDNDCADDHDEDDLNILQIVVIVVAVIIFSAFLSAKDFLSDNRYAKK